MPNDRIVFTATLGELAEVPGTPFAYWAPKSLRDLFQKYPPLDRDVARQPDKPKIADVKQGLATADDLRFTRYWWEVPVKQIATSSEETSQGKKWVPFAKGVKRFYSNLDLVVNWNNDGQEIREFLNAVIRNETFYFRAGLTWSSIVNSPRIDMHVMPVGCIFTQNHYALFAFRTQNDRALLGALNSELLAYLTEFLDPLEHTRIQSTIAKLPSVPVLLSNETLARLAQEAHDLLREWATGDETATVFVAPWILQVWDAVQDGWNEMTTRPVTGHPLAQDFAWSDWESAGRIRKFVGAGLVPALNGQPQGLPLQKLAELCVERGRLLRQCLEEIQRQIDEEVYRLYGISDEDRALIEAELGGVSEGEEEDETTGPAEAEEETAAEELMPAEEHIKRLVHYLAHEVLKEDPDGIVPLYDTYTADGRLERGLTHRVRERLREIFGEAALATVEQDLREALGRPLDDWLGREFFSYHLGLYRLRPIIWQIVSRTRGQPAFSCFLYWHKLDADTLRKAQEVYLRPALESARRERERLTTQLTEQQAAGTSLRALRDVERAWRQAEERHDELHHLGERIQGLLRPYRLSVQSRSAWVPEKVNEVVAEGFRPNCDYGVRVNIEPLKQAEILPVAASRVRG